MKVILIAAFAILTVDALSDFELWAEFKIKHNKVYRNENEEKHRLNIFLSNKKVIEQHNARYAAGLETYSMGYTPFVDMTEEEFDDFIGGIKHHLPSDDDVYFEKCNYSVPDTVDWRDAGIVGPIRSQGCGDCWAHASTGVVEGHYALKHGTFTSLSRQNLVDCTFVYGNGGCAGGKYPHTYHYLRELGVNNEDDYPYEGGKNSFCRFNATKSTTKISGSLHIHTLDEEAVMQAVANRGPVTAVMDSKHHMNKYTEGVYSNPDCTTNTNHAVLIIGYGTDEDKPYWLIKNSWGTKWGLEGYMKILRNSNMCGIANQNTFPVMP